MQTITEKDLLNALAPYRPMRAFQEFIDADKDFAEVKNIRQEILKLTKQRNHLKSEIAKLQKNRLVWLQEEVKERKKLKEAKGAIRKKISNAELIQQLVDFRVSQKMTYTELAKLIGIHVSALHAYIHNSPQRGKHLPAIKKFLQKYHAN